MEHAPGTTHDNRPLCITLFAALVILLLSQWRHPASPPQPATIPDDQFSSERAFTLLESLIGDALPHPADTDQNQVVRERIKHYLTGWDYEVEQHVTENGGVPLVNLLVRVEGTAPDGKAVMLASHHDSVPQGPGAADDGAAVAASLEIMRMLRQQPPPKNDLILLITDGEEFGMLGAERFVAEHAWAADVAIVLNFEARGSSGPSCMFETAENNQHIVELFARHSPHPRTSSLFYEIYKIMPNNTDFTIFKEAGMQGLNFAFIGDVKNYHTPNDDLQHLDRGSLQHHGENAWAMILALANADLESLTSASDNAVYFDVFGWFVVRWPQRFTLPFAAFSAALTFVALARMLKRDPPPTLQPTYYAFLLGFASPACAVWAILLGLSTSTILAQGWPQAALAIELALASAALLALVGTTQLLPQGCHRSVHAGVWLGVAMLALLTGWQLPGGAYFFVVPLLIGGVLNLVPVLSATGLAEVAWPVCLLALCLPVERLFYDALGFTSAPLVAARIGLCSAAIFPQLAQASRKCRAALSISSAVLFVATMAWAYFG